MRVPTRVVVAIFGRTCSGKTTVARSLESRLGAPARHCGDIVRARANALAVAPSALPVGIHKEIDDETREIARSHAQGNLVIEGSFLHIVLADVEHIAFVELTADDATRNARHVGRGGVGDVSVRDGEDDNTVRSLYGDHRREAAAQLRLDTTVLSIDAVVDAICAGLGLSP